MHDISGSIADWTLVASLAQGVEGVRQAVFTSYVAVVDCIVSRLRREALKNLVPGRLLAETDCTEEWNEWGVTRRLLVQLGGAAGSSVP